MAYVKALDVSEWQGSIDWNAVKSAGYAIAILKMSGGDAGLYTDKKANANYYGAKAAGMLVAGYHFAGGQNPENEADFFLACMSPLEVDDVLILDWEINNPNPVEWCRRFIQRLKDRSAPIPMLYINNYTENSLDWTPVVNQNVALYLANYSITPEQDATLMHFKTYIMHQYTSSGAVAGIAGRVDLDAWFGNTAQFKAYGWHTATPTAENPAPAPSPPPAPAPPPPATPVENSPTPVSPPPPPIVADPAPVIIAHTPVKDNTEQLNWLVRAVRAILRLFHLRVK
jgi:GH25 family lysozyme M1 (1,4-beta-N-acetylmuramidase)